MNRRPSGSDTSILELESLNQKERIIKACDGHTFSKGGLNMKHLLELAKRTGVTVQEGVTREILQDLICNWYLAEPSDVERVLGSPCCGPKTFFPELNADYLPEFTERVTEHIQGLIDKDRDRYDQSPTVQYNHYANLIKKAREKGDKDEVKRLRNLQKPLLKLRTKPEHSQFAVYYNALLKDIRRVGTMGRIIGMIKGASFSEWFKPYYFNTNGLTMARKLSKDRKEDLENAARHFLYCIDAVHPEPLPEICVYRWQTMKDVRNITELHSGYTNLDIGERLYFPFPLSTTWNYPWLVSSSFKSSQCCLLVIRVPAGQKYWAIPNDSQYEVALAAGYADIINRGAIEHRGHLVDVVELRYTSDLNMRYISVCDPNDDLDRLLSQVRRNPAVKWLDSKEAQDAGITEDIVREIKMALLDGLRRDTAKLSQVFQETIHDWARSVVVKGLDRSDA